MKRLLLPSAMALLAGCATVDSRPCPRTTEFPAALQAQAATEMESSPALARMMDDMAVDRAFNREICS